MKILPLNNYQTQNNKKQQVNFEAAKFDTSETYKIVKAYIPLERLDKFLIRNKLEVPQGAQSCHIVKAEGEYILKNELSPKFLIEDARTITKDIVNNILEPVEKASSISSKAFEDLEPIQNNRMKLNGSDKKLDNDAMLAEVNYRKAHRELNVTIEDARDKLMELISAVL